VPVTWPQLGGTGPLFSNLGVLPIQAHHTAAHWVILPNPLGSSRIRISLWGDLRGAEKEGSGRSGTVDGSTNGGFYNQKHWRIHKLRLEWTQDLDLSVKNWEWNMLICCSRDSPKKELWNDFAICTLLSHGATLQNSGDIFLTMAARAWWMPKVPLRIMVSMGKSSNFPGGFEKLPRYWRLHRNHSKYSLWTITISNR